MERRAGSAPGLRPGDLLYFGASEKKITHTGMYIGDGQFINATVHGHPVVQIDQLDEPLDQTVRGGKETEMNRRKWLRTAAAVPAAARAAMAAAPYGTSWQPDVRLQLKHTWTTTMSSSQFRDTFVLRYTKDGVTGLARARPSCDTTRMRAARRRHGRHARLSRRGRPVAVREDRR